MSKTPDDVDKAVSQVIKALIESPPEDRLNRAMECTASITATILSGVKDEYLDEIRVRFWDSFAAMMAVSSSVRVMSTEHRPVKGEE